MLFFIVVSPDNPFYYGLLWKLTLITPLIIFTRFQILNSKILCQTEFVCFLTLLCTSKIVWSLKICRTVELYTYWFQFATFLTFAWWVIDILTFGRSAKVVRLRWLKYGGKNKTLICVCIFIGPVRKLSKGIGFVMLDRTGKRWIYFLMVLIGKLL